MLQRGAISGGVAAGVLIMAGALPAQADAQLFSLIGLIALGTAVGDFAAFSADTILGTGN